MSYGCVRIYRNLELAVDTSTGEQRVQLSRIAAQHIADALQEYAGTGARGMSKAGTMDKVYLGARDANPKPRPVTYRGPVRIGPVKLK